jgi:hypothetical protein
LIIRAASLFACLSLAACAPEKEVDVYRTSMPLNDVMGHIISPAAFAFWGAWGEVSREDGVHNLRPTTEAGWEAAENGAATVADAANLLLLPSRRRDDGDWVKYTQAMSDVALEALEATEARDSVRMGVIGGKLDEACETCHEKYAPEATGK